MAKPPGLTVEQALHLAVQHHQAGRRREAAACLQAVLAAQPDRADLRFALGTLLHEEGQLARALHHYRAALALRPDLVEASDNAGTALTGVGALDAAAAAHRRAARLAPGFVQGRINLGGALGRLGRYAEAERCLRAAAALVPDSADAFYNLAKLQELLERPDTAADGYRRAVALRPGYAAAAGNLGAVLRRGGRPAEALPWLELALRTDARELGALNTLVMTLADLGREAEAQARGEALLALKDGRARARAAALDLPTGLRAPAAPRGGQDVIAFSLWGDLPVYTQGALANLRLAATLYPGWRCRFYVDDTVPADVRAALEDGGAQVVPVGESRALVHGAFWRFYAADDPSVRRFLCRDCDARLNTQERAAVDEWIASSKPFHIMRDHLYHADLMLAGLWGGVAGWLPPLQPLIDRLYRGNHDRWSDQDFLAVAVWPQVAAHACIHDSHYRLFGAVPFPAEGRLTRPAHVGEGIAV